MAVVTLKDLMDPLTKIQAATESSAESMGAMSMAINSLAAKKTGGATLIEKLLLINSTKQTKLLEQIASNGGSATGGGGETEGGGKDNKSLKEGAMALKALGAGAGSLAKGLIIFNFVPTKAISKFKETLFDLYGTISNFKTKDLKEGAEAFQIMATSIGTFAKNLALSAVLLPIGLVGVSLLKTALKLITPAFIKLGEQSKEINNGAETLHLMGTSLLSFAKGLVLASLAAIVGIVAVPFLIASIVLIGGAMALLGKLSGPIKKGAKSLDKMGDGLKSFGIGLGIFALATFFIMKDPELVGQMAMTLIIVGGAIALLGIANKQIIKGSIALALMGVGLVLFGVGYAIFAGAVASSAPTLDDILLQAGILVGLGVATAILGSFVVNIGLGTLSLALMGIGLAIFGFGYTSFAKSTKDATLESLAVQAGILSAVGLAFAAAGLAAIPIAAGAIAFGAIGLALQELAPGLEAIKKVDFNKTNAADLSFTLGAVAAAFSGVKPEEGFLDNVGNVFSRVAQSGGGLAAAAMYGVAGMALIKLSAGLTAFKDVGWTNEQNLILANTLSGINGAFAQAGGEAATPTGLYGEVFGNAFSPNATEKGIDSVMGAGTALTGIATGLIDFQKLVATQVNFVTLAETVGNVVGFISKAFAAIGGEDQAVESGGFFSGLLGIKSTATEEGIRSVQGAGDALTGIAKGLDGFKGLKNPMETAGKIGKVLGIVGGAFAVIGGAEPADGTAAAISWDTDAIEDGIESVKDTADALTEIAAGLAGFTDIQPEAVATSISTLLTSIGTAFSNLYTTRPEVSKELADFATFIVTLGDVAEKGLLDKAADGISKIADSINKIDIDKTVAFGELFKSSSKLSEDSAAYEALATAVSDIRDMMQSSGGNESGMVGSLISKLGLSDDNSAAKQTDVSKLSLSNDTPAAKQADSSDKQFKALNITLSQLSSAIAKLPTDIAMIELQVAPPA